MFVGVVDDVGSVGAPDCYCAVVQPAGEVLLVRQRKDSRGDFVDVLVGLAVLQCHLLGEVLLLLFHELFRNFL